MWVGGEGAKTGARGHTLGKPSLHVLHDAVLQFEFDVDFMQRGAILALKSEVILDLGLVFYDRVIDDERVL